MNELLLVSLQRAAQLVVDGLWQGVLVAAVVAAGLRLMPRVTAAQRFVVWTAAFALALGLPFLPLTVSGQAATLRPGLGWGAALALLWAGAFAVRSAGLLQQAWRVREIWLAATPVEVSASLQALLAECPRVAQVCISNDVTAPSVIGFFLPRLLIPAAIFADLRDDELAQIVRHECEHLRRYDDWLNLLQKLALAVFPLNPALAFVDRRLGLERELACDAGVVAATGAPLDYAACLTRLAEHRLGSARLALALSAWARRSELARRVYTLLQPVRSLSRVGSRGSLAALACLLLAAAEGGVHAPRMVLFGAVEAPVAAMAVPLTAPSTEPQTGTRVGLATGLTARATPVMFHAASVHAAARIPMRRAVALKRRKQAPGPRLFRTSTTLRMVPAYMVPVRFSYSYAAVPFGNGWLIVQL